jgi:hypothetical protein
MSTETRQTLSKDSKPTLRLFDLTMIVISLGVLGLA